MPAACERNEGRETGLSGRRKGPRWRERGPRLPPPPSPLNELQDSTCSYSNQHSCLLFFIELINSTTPVPERSYIGVSLN